jgi:serine/threonine protein kinase
VFSFGCVLYEMLTGQQAFQGQTVSDILAGVLRVEPDFTVLPKNLNPRLYELLRRCLDKNAKRRWQAAGDLKIELETVAADVHERQQGIQGSYTARRSKLWVVIAAASSLLAVIFAALFFIDNGPARGAALVRSQSPSS